MPVSQGAHYFPLSKSRVIREGFDQLKDNPLACLHPNEATTAELFVLATSDPRTAATMPNGRQSKWSVLRAGAFLTRFREVFGFDMMPHHRKSLEENAAWRAYVAKLQTQTRDAVMDKIKSDALAAYEDFKWSRTEAKAKGDYKETRLAAADHLDRIGATEKPQPTTQNLVFVLKGAPVEAGLLHQSLPAMEVEVVEAPKALESGEPKG